MVHTGKPGLALLVAPVMLLLIKTGDKSSKMEEWRPYDYDKRDIFVVSVRKIFSKG